MYRRSWADIKSYVGYTHFQNCQFVYLSKCAVVEEVRNKTKANAALLHNNSIVILLKCFIVNSSMETHDFPIFLGKLSFFNHPFETQAFTWEQNLFYLFHLHYFQKNNWELIYYLFPEPRRLWMVDMMQ